MSSIFRLEWFAVLGFSVVVLLTTSGCPTSGENPEPVAPPEPVPVESPAGGPIGPPTLPTVEFRQPPSLPASEPLPRPTREPVAEPLSPEPPVASNAEDFAAEKIVNVDKQVPPKPRTGKHSGIPFDPIQVNGPIFVDWPEPKLALVITGMEEGYLEPCGCAGLDRMKGGMGRRHTLFKQLREKGWPVVGIDVGGLARGFGRQAEMKFQTLAESKRKMGYDAIAFGADDLRLPAGELVAVAAGVEDKPSPFVAANVGLFGFDAEITPKSRVIEAGGMKIGVTAILGKQYQKEINNPDVEMSDPEAALAAIVPELKQKVDYLVLLAHATRDESVALAKKFPEFDVVVTSDGPPEPPAAPRTIEGTETLLITIGHKGMDVVVLALFDDADQPLRYQRVPLDSRFPSSPDMKMLMTAYQEQLKIIGFAGLGLRPVPHPQWETNGRFVGSAKCESCHEESYNIWKKTGHGRAYDTLVKLDPPRNFDPECISCHVIGWHPSKFFPYATGFESKEKTPKLIDTGCEDCHGPGAKHVAAELGSDETLQKALRKTMVITKAESEKQQCMSCHDIDNSPDFDFKSYWPLVEHYEED